MTAQGITTNKGKTQTSMIPFNYGAAYLCRMKSMIVSLGYCEHCADCRSIGNGKLQLERYRDVSV